MKRKKLYIPERSDKLHHLLDQNEWKIRHIKGSIDSLITAIDQIAPSKKGKGQPEIRYFEDFDGVRLVYNEILQHREVFACANMSEIIKIFPENLNKFADAVREKKLILKEIVDRSPATEEYLRITKSDLHEIRFFPSGYNVEVDYLIYGDYLTVIDYKAKPPVSILIKHKDIAESSRTIFNSIWASLPPS